MTKPTMALLDYLRKQGMDLEADFLRDAVQVMMQALIELEVSEQIGAEPYERSPWRTTHRNGSRERVREMSILVIQDALNLSELNLDGSHTIAKKGGESVAYQGRKKAKTSNILPITDVNGFVVASTGIIAGNHNDAYHLKPHLQDAFKFMREIGLPFRGAFFNADAGFDTLAARKVCFNYGLVPNIPENKRSRKTVKRGRKRLFNPVVYKHRFSSERSFAWVDKYRCLLVRFDRKDAYSLGGHHIAFAMINLRHLFAEKFQ